MDAAVVYWSGTGNTEEMAKAVGAGIAKAGGTANIYAADSFSSDILTKYDRVAFGCPAMGDEVLEEDIFEPMFTSLEGSLSGKKVVLFGSYDWGDGAWMRDWEDRVKNANAMLVGAGLTVHETPGTDDLIDCENLGKELMDA